MSPVRARSPAPRRLSRVSLISHWSAFVLDGAASCSGLKWPSKVLLRCAFLGDRDPIWHGSGCVPQPAVRPHCDVCWSERVGVAGWCRGGSPSGRFRRREQGLTLALPCRSATRAAPTTGLTGTASSGQRIHRTCPDRSRVGGGGEPPCWRCGEHNHHPVLPAA